MGSVPDGGAHRTDQGHDQQDAKQDQDLHVGHPLHVRALQWCFGGVLRCRQINKRSEKHKDTHIEVVLDEGAASASYNALSRETKPTRRTL